MSIIEEKEKNLNQLINKLNSITLTYSQPNHELEKIKTEKNELMRQKLKLKKNQELLREHKYLKQKILSLQSEVKKRSQLEINNQEIEELSQETENLVSEIENGNVNVKFNNKIIYFLVMMDRKNL